jgi:hypothetical protein
MMPFLYDYFRTNDNRDNIICRIRIAIAIFGICVIVFISLAMIKGYNSASGIVAIFLSLALCVNATAFNYFELEAPSNAKKYYMFLVSRILTLVSVVSATFITFSFLLDYFDLENLNYYLLGIIVLLIALIFFFLCDLIIYGLPFRWINRTREQVDPQNKLERLLNIGTSIVTVITVFKAIYGNNNSNFDGFEILYTLIFFAVYSNFIYYNLQKLSISQTHS